MKGKKGVGPVVIALGAAAFILAIEAIWLSTSIGITVERSMASKEVEVLSAINKLEMAKIGLPYALEYSFSQAVYDVSKNGGYFFHAGVPTYDSIPVWRKYNESYQPNYVDEVVKATLNYLNSYALQAPINIPQYTNMMIKCGIPPGPSITPKYLPQDKDAWTEEQKYIDEAWMAYTKMLKSDTPPTGIGTKSFYGEAPAVFGLKFSFWGAEGKLLDIDNYDKLHFWFKSDNSGTLKIYFDAEDVPYVLTCSLGEYKQEWGWKEYTVDLKKDCNWLTPRKPIMSIGFDLFTATGGTYGYIDNLYLCKNCDVNPNLLGDVDGDGQWQEVSEHCTQPLLTLRAYSNGLISSSGEWYNAYENPNVSKVVQSNIFNMSAIAEENFVDVDWIKENITRTISNNEFDCASDNETVISAVRSALTLNFRQADIQVTTNPIRIVARPECNSTVAAVVEVNIADSFQYLVYDGSLAYRDPVLKFYVISSNDYSYQPI